MIQSHHMNISTPVSKLPHVGPKSQARLQKLGIKNVGELLFHFPHRYEDFSNVIPVSSVIAEKTCSIKGKVIESSKGRSPRRNLPFAEVIIQDNSGAVRAIWFNQPYLADSLKKDTFVVVSGKASYSKNGLQFINPSYEKLSDTSLHTSRVVPVYPQTEGLSSRWLRFILKPILQKELPLKETLPLEIVKEKDLFPLDKALRQIHFPSSMEDAQKAQRRFSFERIFLIQLLLLKKKADIESNKGVSVPMDIPSVKELLSALPFTLTDAQKKCSWQILKDM